MKEKKPIYYYWISSTLKTDFQKDTDEFSEFRVELSHIISNVHEGEEANLHDIVKPVCERIALLHHIVFPSASAIEQLYIYCKFPNSTDPTVQFIININTWRPDDTIPNELSFTVNEYNMLFKDITSDLKTTQANANRKIAILTDYICAKNISDDLSSRIEKFLISWASFNALYTTFRIEYIQPLYNAFKKEVEIELTSVNWSDGNELKYISTFLGLDYDYVYIIYKARNDIIHGNLYLRYKYTGTFFDMLQEYYTFLQETVLRNYKIMFGISDNEKKRRIADIAKKIIISQIENKSNIADDKKAEAKTKVDDKYNSLSQSDWKI